MDKIIFSNKEMGRAVRKSAHGSCEATSGCSGSSLSKGVSPVIATVLLIAITVIMVGLVTTWTTDFTKTNQEIIRNRSLTQTECSGAIIDIEEVFLTNGTSGTARVVVKNVGIVDALTITNGNVFNVSGGNFSASNLPIRNFDRGDVEIVRFENLSITTCANFSRVLISTSCPDASDKWTDKPIC